VIRTPNLPEREERLTIGHVGSETTVIRGKLSGNRRYCYFNYKFFLDDNTRQALLDVPDDNNPQSGHWATILGAVKSRDEFGLIAAEIAGHLGVATSSITREIEKIMEGTG
jgi:hypothetical protein